MPGPGASPPPRKQ
jgi:katanin p60 ATPase-containing subunit A1